MKQFLQLNKLAQQLAAAMLVFVSRLHFLPANVSPLGSYGFFGNPFFFLISVVSFDLFVKGVYPGVFFTYLGFAAYPLLSKLAGSSLKKQITFLPLASFLFFLLSNLGVWWYWYDHTFAALLICYGLAVPFYARTLLSDLFFGYGYLTVTHFKTVSAKMAACRPILEQIVLR